MIDETVAVDRDLDPLQISIGTSQDVKMIITANEMIDIDDVLRPHR